MYTVVHTTKNKHTVVKPSVSVHIAVHTTQKGENLVKSTDKVNTFVKPTMQPKKVMKPLDIVRVVVEPVVKPKAVRRSGRTFWKTVAIKSGLGKDIAKFCKLCYIVREHSHNVIYHF